MRRRKRVLGVLVAALLGATLAACGARSDTASARGAASSEGTALRLGYFPNLTHATAIVGVDKGLFAKALGTSARLEPRTFNAGPSAVEALFSSAIDAAYVGPGPTTNAYVKSNGEAIRVVAGATSGGAALVVQPAVRSVADLRGKKIATPQLGNTQDIALRYWLKQQGLRTDTQGGGDVSVVPQDNSQTLDTFRSGVIDGAWVPEPYASQLVTAGGRVLVDERSLWPGGKFVTTNLVVRTGFLRERPELVERLLQGHVAATASVNARPADAQRNVAEAIGKLTGKPLDVAVLARAWKSLTFTNDPIASSLLAGAKHAQEVGLLQDAKLTGLYDLAPLNKVLKASRQAEVAAP